MPGPKRSYTDEDRAKVYTCLTANDGNVLRTSQDTKVPEATVRLWKKQWEAGGLPAKVEAALPAVAADHLEQVMTVRDMALDKLRDLIPEATVRNLSDLNRIHGTLMDKIDRAQGLPNKTTEVSHTVTHQTSEDVAAILAALANKTIDAVEQRYEIIDAEVVEQPVKGLPAPG